MPATNRLVLIAVLAGGSLRMLGQEPAAVSKADESHGNAVKNLSVTDSTTIKSEVAQFFVHPIKCDSDGNLYLMTGIDATSSIRKLNPKGHRVASFLASAATDLSIDPDESDYVPVVMQIAGKRIAFEFWEPQSRSELIKLTDLEGYEVSTYEGTFKDGDTQRPIGGAFACYAQNPERFIFLFTSDDGFLGFRTLESR